MKEDNFQDFIWKNKNPNSQNNPVLPKASLCFLIVHTPGASLQLIGRSSLISECVSGYVQIEVENHQEVVKGNSFLHCLK